MNQRAVYLKVGGLWAVPHRLRVVPHQLWAESFISKPSSALCVLVLWRYSRLKIVHSALVGALVSLYWTLPEATWPLESCHHVSVRLLHQRGWRSRLWKPFCERRIAVWVSSGNEMNWWAATRTQCQSALIVCVITLLIAQRKEGFFHWTDCKAHYRK